LPEPAREPDGPASGIASECCCIQDCARMELAKCGLAGLAEPWRLHELAGIAGDVAPPDLDLIGAREDGMHLANRRSGETASDHVRVAVLELLR